MFLNAGHLRDLQRASATVVADWLAQGFLRWVHDPTADAFYPHSFVNLGHHPAEVIESLYSHAPIKLQRALRMGIEQLGILCRADCPESRHLSSEQRLDLLKDYLRLCSFTICFSAAKTIAQIAAEDRTYWTPKVHRREIFPSCLSCLGDLAMRFDTSSFAPSRPRKREGVADALISCVGQPEFEARFSPFTLAALVSVLPDQLASHLELLGNHVARLHSESPEQQELAYLTAHRLVDKALPTLKRVFPQLTFRSREARDRWLIDAVFAPQGPLVLQRQPNGAEPMLYDRAHRHAPFSVAHDDWPFVNVQSGILPEPEPNHPQQQLLSATSKSFGDLFNNIPDRMH